jgi:hypothetical protein
MKAILPLALLIVAAGCGGGSSSAGGASTPAGSTAGAATKTSSASAAPRTFDLTTCSDASPCRMAPGTYMLGTDEVASGLKLTLPSGWQSPEANTVNVLFAPAAHPQERMALWLGVSAVQSTGPGHGVTVLRQVGHSPHALVKWLTTNPDFAIIAAPARATIGPGTPAIALTVGVSSTARYGDSGCPWNPRCADMFTSPGLSPQDSYGIGGHEQVRLYLAKATADPGGAFVIILDAPNHHALNQLTAIATPIVHTIQMAS